MYLKNSLWIVPFCFYISGYIAARFIFPYDTVTVPTVVGETVHNALIMLSPLHLYACIVKEQKEDYLPHGTVINQTPLAGQKAKLHQPVYIVVSKKNGNTVPRFNSIARKDIEKIITDQSINAHLYSVARDYPTDVCFAQSPENNDILAIQKPLIIYVAAAVQKSYIWPNMCGLLLESGLEFLERYNIQPHIIHRSNKHETEMTIIQQRPLAGSFVTLSELEDLRVQLVV